MIKKYVNEITEIYDELKEKYHDPVLALNLLNIAVTARNADHMNANISGNLTVKENE